jgi:hypothetical protein
MFDPILGCRIDRRSFFGRVASVPQFQLELGLFLGQQFHSPRSLGSIRRFAGELAISPNIFSADEAVHRSLLKAIGQKNAAPFRRAMQAKCLVADKLLDFAQQKEQV